MVDDGFEDLARQWQQVRANADDLHRQIRQLADSHYVAADAAGMVEVTLNGNGRLIGLRLDDRLCALDAREAAHRINEVLWAAQELVDETYAGAEPELEAQAEQFIARFKAEHHLD